MIDSVRHARSNHREIIDTRGNVRQPITDPDTALAVLSPLPLRTKERRADLAHRRNHLGEALRQRLPRQFIELRLRIEQIDVTWPSFHEKKNDAPRARREMRSFRHQRTCFGTSIA